MKSPPLYLEFSRNLLKILGENGGAEFPLDRLPDGRVTATCRETLVSALKQFLKTCAVPASSPAWCAIDARGVSLRCLLLPVVAGEGLQQVVRLQIESEFPLPPDDLAWGCQILGEPRHQADGSFKQSVLVAAVRKEIIEEYAALLSAAGIAPAFTLSALARTALCPRPPAAYAILEISSAQCELAGLQNNTSAFIRILPSGVATANLPDDTALDTLAKAIRTHWQGPKLYILGSSETAARLMRRLPDDFAGEFIPVSTEEGCSSAILGLQKFAAGQGGLPLVLQLKPVAVAKKFAPPAMGVWGMRAIFLLLAVLLFPNFEAWVMTAPLSQKITVFKAKAQLLETNVDQDLNFLRYLKQNQSPFLESFYLISKAAPAGIHLDSLTMNRRGEVALRGSLRNGDQVADFRAKLIASGFFANVTVEEQSPTPDRQKVNVRMTAQWKPLVQLQAMAVGPALSETNAANGVAGLKPGSGASGLGGKN